MSKKPIYKKVFRVLRDTLTLRSLRKWVSWQIRKAAFEKIVREIESKFGPNTIYIFQAQFYDCNGEKCFNGGAERYVRDLACIISAHGKNAVLVQMGNEQMWERTIGELHVIGVPVRSILSYLEFLRLFRDYVLVIYSGYTDWGKKIHPNILISHGITWDNPHVAIHIDRILRIMSDIDHLVSVDTNTISWLRTTSPVTLADKHITYIPNYVDTETYCPAPRPNDGKVRICFPRRASPERGYWLMSAALPPIMEKYPNVIFDFVGFAHGDAIEADINKHVTQFPGRVNHYVVEPDDMPTVYQRSDISLIPTLYSEGTSLSCLEAQACGNIVISTNVGGLPNLIIDGYNGFLINPNEHELRIALDRAISDPYLCNQVSKNAMTVALTFDKKIWDNRWNEIIKPTR